MSSQELVVQTLRQCNARSQAFIRHQPKPSAMPRSYPRKFMAVAIGSTLHGLQLRLDEYELGDFALLGITSQK